MTIITTMTDEILSDVDPTPTKEEIEVLVGIEDVRIDYQYSTVVTLDDGSRQTEYAIVDGRSKMVAKFIELQQ